MTNFKGSPPIANFGSGENPIVKRKMLAKVRMTSLSLLLLRTDRGFQRGGNVQLLASRAEVLPTAPGSGSRNSFTRHNRPGLARLDAHS